MSQLICALTIYVYNEEFVDESKQIVSDQIATLFYLKKFMFLMVI